MTKDYYKLLQVHYLAEQEIVESAYKRLARKYHPDANPAADSMERMQVINEAYSVLSDPVKRKDYTRIWENLYNRPVQQKNNTESNNKSASQSRQDMRFLLAKARLEEYFTYIKNKDYGNSYEMISSIDKSHISRNDFIKWQKAVAKIYTIQEFKCDISGVYKDKLIMGKMFSDTLEFSVSMTELNLVMDMIQRDSYPKLMLLEDGQWTVFLGYKELEPFINKFDNLTVLLDSKAILNEFAENKSKVDAVTGLMNQRGLMESVEREIARHDRYGNIFSVIMFQFGADKVVNAGEEQAVIGYLLRIFGNIMSENLRKTDIIGRWNYNSLLILLPETGFLPSIKVTRKLQKLIKESIQLLKERSYKISVNYGLAEYHSSLEETLDSIYNQL